ncbi:MAG: DJ-1 family glyoxalase III [Pseudoflavonifractor sp.]|nr:DJ-1 family glyoxalase III [Pseudoflavonifractor sp.]
MVCILLAEGFEESEAIVPADLLRRSGVEVALTSLTGTQVTGSHGITVRADRTLADIRIEELDMLVLPGGLGGVDSIRMDLFATALIQKVYDKKIYLASICAAPTILGSMGLLDGRTAVCYPGMEDELGAAVAQVGTPVVTDGFLITGEAAGSAFAFGLKLVEILKGSATAEQVRHAVHYHG